LATIILPPKPQAIALKGIVNTTESAKK
jgi:hypothetical protein